MAQGGERKPEGPALANLRHPERIRAALVDELSAILEKVVSAARAGDMQAARLIVDRVLPAIKPMELPVVMNPLAGSLPEQGEALLTAMTRGEIAPAQCAQLLMGLGAHARAVEIDAITNRLKTIEQALEHRDGQAP